MIELVRRQKITSVSVKTNVFVVVVVVVFSTHFSLSDAGCTSDAISSRKLRHGGGGWGVNYFGTAAALSARVSAF